MGDLFSEYIGVIAFLIFLVFPKIFRSLVTRGGRTPSPIEKTLEDLLKGEVKLPDVTPEKVIAQRRAELRKVLKRTETLLTAAQELSRRAAVRGGATAKMQVIVDNGATAPLRALQKDIQRIQSRSGPPNDYEVTERRARARRLKRVLGILEQMVDQRIQPAKAELLGILDTAVKDCLLPYLAHAQRTGASYSTRFALSVIDEADPGRAAVLEASAIAVAVVPPSLAEVPRGWVGMVSDISMDVYYSTKGVSKKLFQALGAMPAPVSIPQNANTNMALAGLVGAAMPRIFGDVGAALYLGPGAATGLAATLRRGADEAHAVEWEFGKSATREVPMHLRIFAMCRALYYAGFSGEAERIWESWKQRLGNPTTITLKDAAGKKSTVATALLLQGVVRVVDSLAAAPIAGLGSVPLTNIRGLRCTGPDLARMREIAPSFMNGTPVNAPSRIVIGAALLASEKSPMTERRIGTAALKSIAGKGIGTAPSFASSPDAVGTVIDAALSPAAVIQAVTLGAAFSPRRGF